MSILHPEELRECKLCGHRWRAERWTKGQANRQPLMGEGLGARSQALNRQTKQMRNLSSYERWGICDACGSKKVKTVREDRGGSPTAPAPRLSQATGSTRRSGSERQDQLVPSVEAHAEGDGGQDLVGQLERLARLHAAGGLTDEEFSAAKRLAMDDRFARPLTAPTGEDQQIDEPATVRLLSAGRRKASVVVQIAKLTTLSQREARRIVVSATPKSPYDFDFDGDRAAAQRLREALDRCGARSEMI